MKKAILATKVGMTQIFNADGVLVPVTVLQAGPCVVTQIKTVDNVDTVQFRLDLLTRKKRLLTKMPTERKKFATDMA